MKEDYLLCLVFWDCEREMLLMLLCGTWILGGFDYGFGLRCCLPRRRVL